MVHYKLANEGRQRRGKYTKVLNECHERILTEAINGGAWKLIAAANGVKYKTAHDWIRKGSVPRKQRGGKRHCKLAGEDVNEILGWLESNSQLTLKAICERLRQERNINVSHQTVSKCLDGHLITYKQVQNVPDGRNTPENKRLRQTYVEEIMEYTAQQKHIVFVDEINFNLYCRRNNGRAIRGTRAIVKVPNSKGRNLNIAGVISSTSLEFWERQRVSFKKENFNNFMRRCLRAINARGHNLNDVVVVQDNAPSHCDVQTEEEFNGILICRLAPYSPMLNPIENIWSAVK